MSGTCQPEARSLAVICSNRIERQNMSDRAELHGRVLNFLRNWIDANILHASQETSDDASSLQHRFLTDAVAAGLPLEEVNEEWHRAEIEIRKAFNKRRAGS